MNATINDIRKEMKRLDGISGMNIANTPITLSSRMTRTLGQTHNIKRGDKYEVKDFKFSCKLLNSCKKEDILDTIRHEYAHAYCTIRYQAFCGHDTRWKQAAKKFGAVPSRCADYEGMEIQPNYRFKIACNKCGQEWKYQRESKLVRLLRDDPNGASCPYCGGISFNVKGV